jgi:hypothetical protein
MIASFALSIVGNRLLLRGLKRVNIHSGVELILDGGWQIG